jgi:glycine/D-amino acid oxidase-like deaminating enzyme
MSVQRARAPFDLAIMGAGIVGVLAALQAMRRHPSWRTLLVERSMVGSGATRYSAALAIPLGRNEDQRRMERESDLFYRGLKAEMPGLPLREIPLYLTARQASLEEIRRRCTADGLRQADRSEREHLATVFPGLSLAEDQILLGGVSASYALLDTMTASLALGIAGSERAQIWEGVEITSVRRVEERVVLTATDGREIAARRAILAPGPWVLRGPGAELARSAGLRVKKVVAFHLDLCPRPDDPVLLFFDEDAFLLPILERRQWLFSFTCQVWDCSPDASGLRITEEDRHQGLEVLRRYSPRLADLCTGGRVFCDSYGPEWVPVVTAAPDAPQLVLAAGCSGGGYRLGPAIARRALDAVSGSSIFSTEA